MNTTAVVETVGTGCVRERRSQGPLTKEQLDGAATTVLLLYRRCVLHVYVNKRNQGPLATEKVGWAATRRVMEASP